MMRRGVWLLALLALLGGCGLGEPTGNSPQAECRRQAYDDPAVKRLTIQNMNGGATQDQEFEYDKALHDATNACLRRMGVPVRGGVEPVRQ
jgi:hypothetical protein